MRNEKVISLKPYFQPIFAIFEGFLAPFLPLKHEKKKFPGKNNTIRVFVLLVSMF